MTIAPWIIPPNYLQAIEAGAGTGLRAQSQQAQQGSNAIQDALSGISLMGKEKQGQQALDIRRQQIQQADELRRESMNMLNQYHQGLLNQRAAAADQIAKQKQAELDSLNSYRNIMAEAAKSRAASAASNAESLKSARETLTKQRSAQSPKMSDVDKLQAQQLAAKITAANRAASAAIANNDTATANTYKQKAQQLQDSLDAIYGKYQQGETDAGSSLLGEPDPFGLESTIMGGIPEGDEEDTGTTDEEDPLGILK